MTTRLPCLLLDRPTRTTVTRAVVVIRVLLRERMALAACRAARSLRSTWNASAVLLVCIAAFATVANASPPVTIRVRDNVAAPAHIGLGLWTSHQPTLCLRVIHVRGLISDEQVARVAARRIIAAMEHVQSIGNCAAGQLQGHSMRAARSRLAHREDSEDAVAGLVSFAGPMPTLVVCAPLDAFPKSDCDGASFRSGCAHSKEYNFSNYGSTRFNGRLPK